MNELKLVQRLLPLVSDDIKWSRLEDYLEMEKENLINTLISSQDIKQINRTQGRIQQINLLLNIKEEVRQSVQ